jgi:hypothetical protein
MAGEDVLAAMARLRSRRRPGDVVRHQLAEPIRDTNGPVRVILGRAAVELSPLSSSKSTASGPFIGPPSGRPVDITVRDLALVVDSRMVEHWGVPDRFALLAQTGVLDRLEAATP